jgi:hypothetical protein
MLAYMVYGDSGRVNVGLRGVGRSWACQCLPTQCMEKVSLSMLAYMVYGEGERVYTGLHGVWRWWARLRGSTLVYSTWCL